ncbi:carotenoid oxygenase family protein [Variovorax sp. GB1P17]|uniref:carotenoid oxygenase family protein n=1 Tax=Variovorax sp. GB1P17 TaxID=3443740 RepID=UPI003F469090
MNDVTHPAFVGNYAPVHEEVEVSNLKVIEGVIPNGLSGTLYRNGPNPMFPPIADKHHWFLGEGMVHAVNIQEGRVSYTNRWVRTQQFKAQEAESRRLVATSYEEVFNAALAKELLKGSNEPSEVKPLKLPMEWAGTNAVWHGDRLYALGETNRPILLDGDSLATLGTTSFDGKYTGPMTAHPKIDPETGEMLAFGYQAAGPGTRDIVYFVIDRHGGIVRQERFQAPYCSALHDFLATREHVLFPVFPATIDVQRVAEGGPLVAWDPSLPTRIGIMRRDAGVASMRWFTGPACFVFHPMNAFDVSRDGRHLLVADVMKFDKMPLFPDVTGRNTPGWIKDGMARLVRWTFELDQPGEGYTEELLCEIEGEFPRVDERFAGLPYRSAFYVARLGEYRAGSSFDTLVHVDVETKEVRTCTPDGDLGMLEPVFVARNASSPEGDGWILTIAFDPQRERSDLLIFDAVNISRGPVARVELPKRVPYGFHGTWRSGQDK